MVPDAAQRGQNEQREQRHRHYNGSNCLFVEHFSEAKRDPGHNHILDAAWPKQVAARCYVGDNAKATGGTCTTQFDCSSARSTIVTHFSTRLRSGPSISCCFWRTVNISSAMFSAASTATFSESTMCVDSAI